MSCVLQRNMITARGSDVGIACMSQASISDQWTRWQVSLYLYHCPPDLFLCMNWLHSTSLITPRNCSEPFFISLVTKPIMHLDALYSLHILHNIVFPALFDQTLKSLHRFISVETPFHSQRPRLCSARSSSTPQERLNVLCRNLTPTKMVDCPGLSSSISKTN